MESVAEFVRLGEEDIQDVLELERLCFSFPWSERQFNLSFKQRVFHVFGLKDSGRLLAYLAMYHTGEEMEILNVAVRPELRRQGLASRLLRIVLQIGRNMGMKEVFLEARRSNLAALALYQGHGFVQTGVRKGYYPDNGEDALLLKKEFEPEQSGRV